MIIDNLLLSNNGDIYDFNKNRHRQIGNGRKEIQTKPVKWINDNKFIDIATHFMIDISVSFQLIMNFMFGVNVGNAKNINDYLMHCVFFLKKHIAA